LPAGAAGGGGGSVSRLLWRRGLLLLLLLRPPASSCVESGCGGNCPTIGLRPLPGGSAPAMALHKLNSLGAAVKGLLGVLGLLA